MFIVKSPASAPPNEYVMLPIGIPVIEGITLEYALFSFTLTSDIASMVNVAVSDKSSTVTVQSSISLFPSSSVAVMVNKYILSVLASTGFS